MRLFYLTIFFILSLFSAKSASALTSGFTADFTSGCAPLVVHFHPNDPACGGCVYSWNFGTGSPITGYTASSSFLTVGTTVVSLTVTSGSTTSTSTMTITVYPAPTVNFVADDTAVCPGSTVNFSSTSTSSVPGPLTSSWGFGDGGTGAGSPAGHMYVTPGYYNVTLSVTNAQGCVASLTKPSYVHVYNPPAPNFTASPASVCNPPADVTFTNVTSGAGPFTSYWTFGDGGSSSDPNPVHGYGTTPGTYTVKLVVIDANGCKDSVTRPAYIYVGNLHASFTGPTTACVYSTVNFTNTSTTHTSRTWYYGDGGSTVGVNGVHVYSAPGTYTVKLVVNNGPCSDTVTHTITITPGPTGSFIMSPTPPCPAPVTITYTSTGPAGTIVNWTFEGGVPGVGSSVPHTYTSNGTKSVTMIMTDPVTGCKDTTTITQVIYDLIFQAAALPNQGCVPLTVAFSTTATTTQPLGIVNPYPYPMASYSWDYGDGSAPDAGPTPSHTFTAVGVYTVTVTGVTSNGCPVISTVIVKVGTPPTATFTASPLEACYHNNNIIFDATVVTGPIDSFSWAFGDGPGNDVTGHETHQYTIPGIFTVTLTPYYNGCPGIPYIRTNYITIDSPKSIIDITYNCSPATRVTFGDSSMGDDTHMWIFGDGFTSTADNPIHDYPALTTYIVQLATYNAHSGCRDTASSPVVLATPVVDFTANHVHLCQYDSVTFTSTVTGGTSTSYRWYVNGIYQSTLTTPVITRPFNASGIYSIMLVINDNHGCYDTMNKVNYVTVASPVPNFIGSPVTGCLPLTVTFTDISTDVTGVVLTNFYWNFGDGFSASSTSPTITHTYNTAGVFSVSDTMMDNFGCRDTAWHNAMITVNQPHASFTATNVHPCINVPTTFNNTSTGGVVSSSWTFGDGGSSTDPSPVHSYSATGTYNVTLTVTDGGGCTNSVTMTGYIGVTKPVAAFNMSDSVSVCAPLLVHFYNTSTGATSYNWAFGDLNTSVVPSPTDYYTAPGLYNITLIATNIYGCKDTAHRAINIFGYEGAFSYTPTQGCIPLTVHFSATLTNVPNIIWDFADGNTSTASAVSTIDHIYTTPGAYVPKLILSDNSGCQASSIGADTIKVDGINAKFSTFPNPVCLGTPFNFVDSSTWLWSPITTWAWTYDGNHSSIASPSYEITAPGTYPVHLQVTNGWGCIGVVDQDVVVYPLPVVTADRDTIICLNDTASLHGYGASTYVWTAAPTLLCTSCNPALANPLDVTVYTVTGTDIHGCTDTATVTVGQRTNTIAAAWGDTAVCFGTPVPLFDTGGYFYTWYPSIGLNNSTIFNPIATPPATTTFMVVARIGHCIPDTDYVKVIVYPLPTVDAGDDQRLLAGTPAQLNAIGTLISTYAWTPSESLSCPDCPSPVATMSLMTTYHIRVSTIHGCTADDSVKVTIYCDNSQIFVPNAFTPNGDGENDVFYPRGIGIKIVKSFRIYNRWGEMLFERENIQLNDANNAWDGSFKNGSPRPDVYVYIIDAVCYTGDPVFIKGDVTIIR